MNYCDIDLAGVSSYAYVTDEKGRKLWAGPLKTEKSGFERVVKKFSRGGLSVAIEAGNQTAWVYEELVKLGANVTVVHPTKVKLIAESRRKTDKIDAKILRELLRLDAGFQHDILSIVAAYYESFLALTRSIHELDQQLAEHEKNEPRAARLKTMPKVGRIASLTFLAAVDDVNRFPTSLKLVGYSGLAPTVRQSGERTEYGAISREGRRELRAVWVQIAHLVATDNKRATQPLRTWFNRVARKRGKKTALVALARRLLVIAYQLLKTETDYDAARLKKKRRAA